ncbi:hypothetical protein ACMD2_08321 [Ananas comosus]|uniref:Ricin B-like lectin R40G3 n=1 Tax=Ananas comosus TaxID=4615 RepID=A0A199W478_ANACO|nr:hypothetical protein ACMD2_08321 [Ananas comosus]
MEFPFGHHHHHHRGDDDEERPPQPPPPYHGGAEPYPPPGYGGAAPYPPPGYGGDAPYPSPPPPRHHHEYSPGVEHVSHETYGDAPAPYFPTPPPPRHPHHPSPGVEHESHEIHGGGGVAPRQQTVRIFCKAKEDFSLTIRDGSVVLAPANPRDDYQHWIKDMRYSTKVKDEEGYPAFMLINKATGEALKHSLGQSHPVRLVRFNPNYLDESVLWTESRDVGSGFRCIRMVNNIYLNFDAFHGDKDHGGVKDGTKLVLWEWCEGDNQRWKIVPY